MLGPVGAHSSHDLVPWAGSGVFYEKGVGRTGAKRALVSSFLPRGSSLISWRWRFLKYCFDRDNESSLLCKKEQSSAFEVELGWLSWQLRLDRELHSGVLSAHRETSLNYQRNSALVAVPWQATALEIRIGLQRRLYLPPRDGRSSWSRSVSGQGPSVG